MIQATFRDMLFLTSDPVAAAVLTLAAVIREERSDGLLSVQAAAKRLGLSTKTIYAMCADGSIKSKKIGRAIRIAPADLDRAEADGKTTPAVKLAGFSLSHASNLHANSRPAC